jgi:hypothetical protein
MSEILTSEVPPGVHVLGLPLADRPRAKGADVAAAPDMPDHSRKL